MQLTNLGLSGDAQTITTTVLACESTFNVMMCKYIAFKTAKTTIN